MGKFRDFAKNVTTIIGFNKGIAVSKDNQSGIKVDLDSPTFPFDDILGPVIIQSTGPTAPNWTTYQGQQMAHEFSVNDECQHTFHIPHEYVAGTDVFAHIHWSHNSATITTGAPTFTYYASYAKGHNQAAFSADVTGTISENASLTQYQQMVTEVQLSAATPGASQIDSDNLEPDGIIMFHTVLTANTMDGGALPFIHHIDLHFQTTGIGTKSKTPNFYT